MNSQEFMEDMKQLLRAEISGVVQHLDKRIDGLERRMDGIEKRMATKEDLTQLRREFKTDLNESHEAIAETLNTGLDSVASKPQVDDHERRITRLEHRPV
ncbi:hypothetical protein [Saccharothrix texasensis]|uniref:hypothetical protein n=1 Tax=Saccharothrix texasensis TaxID=103734 RepID=UPI0011CE6C18|nr:hypothetical protein [Saccharothrix texasensis]